MTYVEEVAAADRFELSNAEFKVPCLNHLAKRLCSGDCIEQTDEISILTFNDPIQDCSISIKGYSNYCVISSLFAQAKWLRRQDSNL